MPQPVKGVILLYVLTMFFPLVGIVAGAIFLTDPVKHDLGRNLLILGLAMTFLPMFILLPLGCVVGFLRGM